METKSNSLADFIEIRDALNQVLEKPDEFVIIGCSCGTTNAEDRRESPYPVHGFRFQLSFVNKAEAAESDIKNSFKPLEKASPVPSLDPKNILAGINLITISGDIKGSDEPSLVYIASQTTSGILFRAGRTEYFLGIMVDSVTAEQYDQVQRKPVNAESLQDMLKDSIVDEKI